MGINKLPDQRRWVQRTREGDVTGPSAGANLVTYESSYESKLTRLEIHSDRGGFFEVIERNHNGSSPTTRASLRIPSGGGEAHRKGTLEDPILTWAAGKELTVQIVPSGGVAERAEVWITFWEEQP